MYVYTHLHMYTIRIACLNHGGFSPGSPLSERRAAASAPRTELHPLMQKGPAQVSIYLSLSLSLSLYIYVNRYTYIYIYTYVYIYIYM